MPGAKPNPEALEKAEKATMRERIAATERPSPFDSREDALSRRGLDC